MIEVVVIIIAIVVIVVIILEIILIVILMLVILHVYVRRRVSLRQVQSSSLRALDLAHGEVEPRLEARSLRIPLAVNRVVYIHMYIYIYGEIGIMENTMGITIMGLG